MSNDVGFFDPNQPIADLAGNLPHWRQEGVTYFVTFRLADAVPQDAVNRMKRERDEWLLRHPEPHDRKTRDEYYRQFVERVHKWMDAGHGECHFKRRDVRKIVADALKHFDEVRYVLREWIIMPNHVHATVSPIAGFDLSDILHSWKSFTGNEINRMLSRTGALWQKESFDHIVRNAEQLDRIEWYIHDNADGLSEGSYSRGCLHRRGREAAST